jgi:glucose-1-phosphate thymidylyltransferase
MKIVIPTAGFGTRMRPHTWSKPKPLVPVAGKPVLGHVLDMFSTLPEINEVTFIIGYLGDQIEEYVQEAYPDLNARYVEQKELIGQSHAIWLAREGLEGPMLMAFVDTLIEADLSDLASEEAEAVAWVKEVPDPRRFGVADVDEQGWVSRLIEKPKDPSINLAVVGVYYFQEAARLIEAIERQMDQGEKLGGEYYLADAINVMLEDGLQMRVEEVEVWEDCGKPDALLDTNRYLLEHGRDNSAEAMRREGTVIVPPVYVNPSADLHLAVIGPHVSIGPGCTIHRSMLMNTVVDAGSHVAGCSLTDSLIGRNARVSGVSRSVNIGDNADVDFGS